MKKDLLNEKKKEFTALLLSGKYTQKELSARLGISEKTASRWANGADSRQLLKAKANLSKELERLTNQPYDSATAVLISGLVADIEKISHLIEKEAR